MIVQKWHVEAAGQELSRKKVPAFLNTSMSKNWTADNVINHGVYPIIETPKPEITSLQRIEAGERIKVGDEYHRVWNIVDKFDTQEEIDEFLEQELSDKRLRIQAKNKADCKAFILSHYDEETQRNAALGLYSQDKVSAMADHIAAIVAVENATWDLIEESDDPESVIDPVWPEV